jgi:hypothetical protein
MFKKFDYNHEKTEVNRVSNEIIDLLNKHSLEQRTVFDILNRVNEEVESSNSHAVIPIQNIDTQKCTPLTIFRQV